MKNKIITANIIAIFIILLASVSYAATGTVELKASTTEVKKGDTFTVTISATCEEGINAIKTKYSYDTDKLELVDEKLIDTSKWITMGTQPELIILSNSRDSIKSADLYVITFKVKDNVSAGDTVKVETEEIILSANVKEDSTVTVGAKTIEISVKDNSAGGNQGGDVGGNTVDNPGNNSGIKTNTTENNGTKKDPTSANGTLPQTGESFIIVCILIVGAISASIILYKKYIKYKGV